MLKIAAPVLASLNMANTLHFYASKLGFEISYSDENYGIVHRDEIQLHFWKCNDKIHPENTSCYVYVDEIELLYEEMQQANVVHPNGKLEEKPWGMKEFAITDEDGNLIRFGRNIEAFET